MGGDEEAHHQVRTLFRIQLDLNFAYFRKEYQKRCSGLHKEAPRVTLETGLHS